MPTEIPFLTTADVAKLRDRLNQLDRQLRNTANRPAIVTQEIQTPDVYVVRIPTGGIAASTEEPGTGTGTGSISEGSGTLRSAECDVYLLTTENGYPELIETGVTQVVYNLSTVAIPGDIWALSIRDKYGTWYTDAGSSIGIGTPFTGTPQSVIFIGPTNLLAEDANNFTYDSTTGRLTVKKASPEVRLTTTGDGNHFRVSRTDVSGEVEFYNVVAVPGETAYSLSFAGGTEVVQFGNTSLPTGAAARTVMIWFKLAANSNQEFISYGGNGGTGQRFALFRDTVAGLGFEISGASGTIAWSYDTNWHSLVAVVPSGASTCSDVLLYYDGALQSPSFSSGGTALVTASTDPVLGTISGANGLYQVNGLLDDARIYARALTAGEISAYHSSQTEPSATSLVVHLKLDEGTGTNASDSSGNGNSGTLVNGPTWSSDVPAGAPGTTPATDTELKFIYFKDGTEASEGGKSGFGSTTGHSNIHYGTRFNIHLGAAETEVARWDEVGRAGFYTTAPAASVHSKARVASEPAVISQGTTSQAQSIHQFRDSADTNLMEVEADGDPIWNAQTSTQERPQLSIERGWSVSTDASRLSYFDLYLHYWGGALKIISGGTTAAGNPMIGVLGATEIEAQDITGTYYGTGANVLAQAFKDFGYGTGTITDGGTPLTTAITSIVGDTGGSATGPAVTFTVSHTGSSWQFVRSTNTITLTAPYADATVAGLVSVTLTTANQILGAGVKTVQQLGIETTYGSESDFDAIVSATGSATILPAIIVDARDTFGYDYDTPLTLLAGATGGIKIAHLGFSPIYTDTFIPEDYLGVGTTNDWFCYAYEDSSSFGFRTVYTGSQVTATHERVHEFLIGVGTFYRWGYDPPQLASVPLSPGTGDSSYEDHLYSVLYTHLAVAGDIVAGGGLQLGPNGSPNYNERFAMWFGGGGNGNLHVERHGDHSVEHRLYTGPEFGAVGPGAYWFEYNGTDEGTGTGQTGYFRFVIGKLSEGDPEVVHSYFDGSTYWDGDSGTMADGSIVKAGLVVGLGNIIDCGTWE